MGPPERILRERSAGAPGALPGPQAGGELRALSCRDPLVTRFRTCGWWGRRFGRVDDLDEGRRRTVSTVRATLVDRWTPMTIEAGKLIHALPRFSGPGRCPVRPCRSGHASPRGRGGRRGVVAPPRRRRRTASVPGIPSAQSSTTSSHASRSVPGTGTGWSGRLDDHLKQCSRSGSRSSSQRRIRIHSPLPARSRPAPILSRRCPPSYPGPPWVSSARPSELDRSGPPVGRPRHHPQAANGRRGACIAHDCASRFSHCPPWWRASSSCPHP